jgi:tripartite ATP-independent transporter DctP family solute receptor
MKPFYTPLVLGVIAQALLFTASPAIAADVNEHSIKLGYGTPAEHPIGQGVNKFAELVGQKSGGKIKIRTYPASVLGSDTQMISATQGGVQEVVAVSSAPLMGMVKEFALFDFPYLFADEKEADAVLDGPVGRRMFEKLADKGLIGLCFFENGFRNVTNSKRPIVKVDDIAGLKIRTIQSPVYLDTFNTLGANAVPMPFPEVYTALDVKAIDGQENPYANIHASKYYEVQKYLSATKHAYGPLPVMVSGKFWDKLTPQEKTILQDSCAEARQHQRRVNRDQSAALLADLKAKGMVFNEVAPEEIAKMRQKLKPVVDKYTKEVGEDLVKQTYAEIEKLK